MQLTPADNIKGYERAKEERQNFSNAWQDVADLVLPTRQFTSQPTPGQQRHNKIFNTTAPDAVETLAAALDGLLTNSAIRWFALALENFDESMDEEAASWLYECTTLVLDFLASPISGYPMASHESYLDLVAFGTQVTQAVENIGTGQLRFRARALANHYICENDEGEIDEQYRFFEPTAKELNSMFPDGTFSQKVQDMLKDVNQCHKRVPMVHCIYKRYEYDPGRRDRKNKPWASRYIEVETKNLVWEGGFDTNPFIVSRWSKAAEECYGRSPAMNVLPAIKVVNAKEKVLLMAGEKVVNPPMNVQSGSMEGGLKLAPASINYVKAGTQPPTPMLQNINLPWGRAELEADEIKIQRAFFLDALQLPQIDRMTREEVITRRQQGLLKASPILSRLYTEKIGPEITLTFNWMQRTNQLPPAPESIRRRKLTTHYVSPMALSRRQSEAENFTAAMATAAPLEGVSPGTITKNMDVNRTFRTIMSNHNVDPKMMRTVREVAALEKSQQDAKDTAQTIALAQGGAGAIRDGAAAVKDLTQSAPVI